MESSVIDVKCSECGLAAITSNRTVYYHDNKPICQRCMTRIGMAIIDPNGCISLNNKCPKCGKGGDIFRRLDKWMCMDCLRLEDPIDLDPPIIETMEAVTADPEIEYFQCDCEDWKLSMPQIDGAQVLSQIHNGAPYTGKPFRLCPWCGKQRYKTKDK